MSSEFDEHAASEVLPIPQRPWSVRLRRYLTPDPSLRCRKTSPRGRKLSVLHHGRVGGMESRKTGQDPDLREPLVKIRATLAVQTGTWGYRLFKTFVNLRLLLLWYIPDTGWHGHGSGQGGLPNSFAFRLFHSVRNSPLNKGEDCREMFE